MFFMDPSQRWHQRKMPLREPGRFLEAQRPGGKSNAGEARRCWLGLGLSLSPEISTGLYVDVLSFSFPDISWIQRRLD